MNRIVHLALKVDELERASEFYRTVFGFLEVQTERVRDHVSRHLSDGEIDLSLMQYDAGSRSAEALAAGDAPCIHHFAVEVEDLEAAARRIEALGGTRISDPGVIPAKYRVPGGTVMEIVPPGRFRRPDR